MDHQGSVRAITNHAEVTQIAYTTDAFGSQIVAPTGANTAIPNDPIFHSNWITADTTGGRFCISPSRLYAPAIGGFLERDPLPYVQKVAGAAMDNALASYEVNNLLSPALIEFTKFEGHHNASHRPMRPHSPVHVYFKHHLLVHWVQNRRSPLRV